MKDAELMTTESTVRLIPQRWLIEIAGEIVPWCDLISLSDNRVRVVWWVPCTSNAGPGRFHESEEFDTQEEAVSCIVKQYKEAQNA